MAKNSQPLAEQGTQGTGSEVRNTEETSAFRQSPVEAGMGEEKGTELHVSAGAAPVVINLTINVYTS